MNILIWFSFLWAQIANILDVVRNIAENQCTFILFALIIFLHLTLLLSVYKTNKRHHRSQKSTKEGG